MTRTRGLVVAALAAVALGAPTVTRAQQAPAFPHLRHAELFTNCLDCHAGIPTGDKARVFPVAADCAVCHDAQAGKEAKWTPRPAGGSGLLAFSHPAHAKRVGKDVTCQTCHAERVGAPPMAVTRAAPERCISCHAHEARAHKADDNKCATCHRPGRAVVHVAGFRRDHGNSAAAQAATCADCHVQRFCTDCHAGERNARRYHPSNYVSRHAPEAFTRDVECTSCHSTVSFCRDCHTQTGRSAVAGARSVRYHNAQPQWLLQHGRAARQELTTCASCHQQTYCMQCHSDVGWRINPHGPDFDAAQMARRNSQICLVCHFKNPLGK